MRTAAAAPIRSALPALAAALLLAACGDQGGTEPATAPDALATCPAETTPIHTVQGTDWQSPFMGQVRAVTGVVTLTTPAGLYIESLQPDRDPNTSEGLFLATDQPRHLAITPGTVVAARGEVAELGEVRDTQTALVALQSLQPCGAPRARPLANARLPLGGRDREALENMRVTLDSRSVVTDVFRLHEGSFRVARDFPLPQPTEVERPGRLASERDGRNWAYSVHARLAPGDEAIFAVGDEILSDQGVLGNEGRGPLLLLEAPVRVYRQPLPTLDPPGEGIQRVVSLNLENYFNGDGRGGGFPTPRGAETQGEFDAQRTRFAAAIEMLKPDLLAVQEIENDGFGPYSAAEDFRTLLEDVTGHPWAIADPGSGQVGTDQIAVGLFYRSDRFVPIGPARLLDDAPFDLLNRTPLAQALRYRNGRESMVIVVNHFKSKGGCPEQGRDQDQGDGQACWNPTRLAAARALVPWVSLLADEVADGRALVLGDLNAYRMEDPVQHLVREGLVDLTASVGEQHRYSYVFRGQSGTLDHAFATRPLASRVAAAHILNVNAGFPRRMTLDPPWLGASDHDPVIVDVRFTQSSTSD